MVSVATTLHVLKRNFLFFSTLLIVCFTAHADVENDVIPETSTMRTGTLENGLSYMIYPNKKPSASVEMSLHVNIGSLQENDFQLGYAHLLEHLAFKGTVDFPGDSITTYLAEQGVLIGQHLNAYTAFDETVYFFSLPKNNAKNISTGIKILENWAHKITVSEHGLEQEKPIVLEEKRQIKGLRERIQRAREEAVFNNSRHQKRHPIGKEETIRRASAESIHQFYKDWYTPENMTVVIVGDVDDEAIEKQIQQVFSAIPSAGVDAKPVEHYAIPDRQDISPSVVITTDPELTTSQVSVSFRIDNPAPNTYAGWQMALQQNLLAQLINERLKQVVIEPDSAILGANVKIFDIVKGERVFELFAKSRPGQSTQAYKKLIDTLYQAEAKGFTRAEFNSTKSDFLSNQITYLSQKQESALSSKLSFEVVQAIKAGHGFIDYAQRRQATEKVAEEVTRKAVEKTLSQILETQNSIVMISHPENVTEAQLTKSMLASYLLKAPKARYKKFVYLAKPSELIPTLPTAGTIAETEYDDRVGITIYTLSNGATLMYKHTRNKPKEFNLTAISPGGYATVSTDLLPKVREAHVVIPLLGLGELSNQALNQFKGGKQISLESRIHQNYEELLAFAHSSDFETLMQMVHLTFEAPKKDLKTFNLIKRNFSQTLSQQLNSPEVFFSKVIHDVIHAKEPRLPYFDAEQASFLDLDAMHKFYNERYSNAADFTFIVVGDVKQEEVEKYARLYLASLPSTTEKETKKRLPLNLVKGNIELNVERGLADKSFVVISIHDELPHHIRNSRKLSAFAHVLEETLRNELREKRGGVYSVNVNKDYSTDFLENTASLSVSFQTDPARVNEMKSAVGEVIEQIGNKNFDQDLIDSYIKSKTKLLAKNLETTNWYYSHLHKQEALGEHVVWPNEYVAQLELLNKEEIADIARLFMHSENKLTATLLPEAAK